MTEDVPVESSGGRDAEATKGSSKKPRAKNVGKDAVRAAAAGAIPLIAETLPPEVNLPPGFRMDETGLWYAPRTDDKPLRLTGPFEVMAQSREKLGTNWGLLLRWRDRDGRVHEWIMPSALLQTEGPEVRQRLAHQGLYVSANPKARAALLQFLTDVHTDARIRTVPRTGWHFAEHGGAAFILPGGNIGTLPGDEVVRLDMDPPPAVYAARGTLPEWQANVAARCLGNTRLLFGVSCAFAAPLLALVGDEGGGFNLRGGSSTGKTTVIDAAASAWGAPSKVSPDTFVRSWRHTANALEETAAAHNDALLCLDEMGEASGRDIPETLYMLANGVGKTRRNAGVGNRRGTTWLTLVLSSSEHSVAAMAEEAGRNIKAGQEVRLLDVPAVVTDGFGCFEDLHGAADGAAFSEQLRRAMRTSHGTAAPAFVAYLAKCMVDNPDFIAHVVRPAIDDWCRSTVPEGADGQVYRAARRLALVALAGELAIDAGITGWPVDAASHAVKRIFRDWLRERGGAGSRESHYLETVFRRFMEAHGAARFAVVDPPGRRTQARLDEPQGDPALSAQITINRAGFRWQETNDKGGRFWVYGILPAAFDAEIAGAPEVRMSGREAKERLAKAGMIETFTELGKTRYDTKSHRIDGKQWRLIMVRMDGLD